MELEYFIIHFWYVSDLKIGFYSQNTMTVKTVFMHNRTVFQCFWCLCEESYDVLTLLNYLLMYFLSVFVRSWFHSFTVPEHLITYTANNTNSWWCVKFYSVILLFITSQFLPFLSSLLSLRLQFWTSLCLYKWSWFDSNLRKV